ncbi:hypothetical protein HYU07_03780 [Candidatus Woesearchaeota archaeon]|nr:hypothetical protein [Candidatus Woesearchaeota archaeon]
MPLPEGSTYAGMSKEEIRGRIADIKKRMAQGGAENRPLAQLAAKEQQMAAERMMSPVQRVQSGMREAAVRAQDVRNYVVEKGQSVRNYIDEKRGDTTLLKIIFLALMTFHIIDASTGFAAYGDIFNLRVLIYLIGASVVLFLFYFKEKEWPLIAPKFFDVEGPEYGVGRLKFHFGRIAGLFLTIVFYSLIYRYMPDIQRMFLPLGALGNTIYVVLVVALVLTILYFIFEKRTWEALFQSVMLGFLATFIPVYLPYLSNFGVDKAVIDIVLLFFPVYYVYFVFIAPPNNKFFKWLRNITIIIWLFIFLMTAYSAIEAGTMSNIPNFHAIPGVEAAMQPSALGALTDFWRLVSNSFKDFASAIAVIPANIAKSWNQYAIYASGGYYQGTVEQNQNTPLGVYIDQLKSASPKFYEGETVSVYARLHGKSLEKKKNGKPTTITVICKNDKNKAVKVSPEKVDMYAAVEESIDCWVSDATAGSMKIELSASFDFTTMGYLKTYFIDKDKYEDFQKSGIDVFRHYGIEENPDAIYTNGPIMLGIGSRDPPVAIPSETSEIEKEKILVAVTIENQWGGVINDVKGITVEIPEGLEIIDPAGKDCPYLKLDKNEGGYNKYALAKPLQKESLFSKDATIETFRSIRCFAKITDRNKLLGTTPISTKYIRADVTYSYTVKKDITVDIEKSISQ